MEGGGEVVHTKSMGGGGLNDILRSMIVKILFNTAQDMRSHFKAENSL